MSRPAILIVLFVLLCAPWVVNAYKLTECDFESNYKCELFHTIGIVIPPAAWITVWFGTDEE